MKDNVRIPRKRLELLNQVLWYTFVSMKGEVIMITTKSGHRYIGVLSQIIENMNEKTLDIILEYVQIHNGSIGSNGNGNGNGNDGNNGIFLEDTIDLHKFCNGTSYLPQLKINSNDLTHLYAPKILFDHEKHLIDPDSIGKERELKPFHCDDNDNNNNNNNNNNDIINNDITNNDNIDNDNNDNDDIHLKQQKKKKKNDSSSSTAIDILSWSGNDQEIDQELKKIDPTFDQFKDKDTTYHEGLYNQSTSTNQITPMVEEAKALADQITAKTTTNPHVLEDRNVELNNSGYMDEEDLFSAVQTNTASKPTKVPTKPPIKSKPSPIGSGNAYNFADISFIDSDITRKHLLKFPHSIRVADGDNSNNVQKNPINTQIQSNATIAVATNMIQNGNKEDIIETDDNKISKLNPHAIEFNPEAFVADIVNTNRQKIPSQDANIDSTSTLNTSINNINTNTNINTNINSNTNATTNSTPTVISNTTPNTNTSNTVSAVGSTNINVNPFTNTNQPNANGLASLTSNPLGINPSTFYSLLPFLNMTNLMGNTNISNTVNDSNNLNNLNTFNPFNSLIGLNTLNNFNLNNFNALSNLSTLNIPNFNLPLGTINPSTGINMGLGVNVPQLPLNINLNDVNLNNLSSMNFVNGLTNTTAGSSNEFPNTMNISDIRPSTMISENLPRMNVVTPSTGINVNSATTTTNTHAFTPQQVSKDNTVQTQTAFKPFTPTLATPIGGTLPFVSTPTNQISTTTQPQHNFNPFSVNYPFNSQ